MSNRWPGGLIRKTPVTPTTASAVGVWTLAEAMYWTKQGQWPTPGDPDFDYVSLLLPGNGTNGAQNNTFLDSSTNNFTLTRNGDTTQGSFSPYGDLWSNYFDGSGDYLGIADNAALEFGTNEFCIEGWCYPTSSSGSGVLVAKRPNGASATGFIVFRNQNNYQLVFAASANGSTWGIVDNVAFGTMTANAWNHFAVYRIGNAWYGALNGTVTVLNASNSSGIVNNTSSVYVGADATSNGFTGYLSNVRLVNGSPVYTSTNFTPPTAPLTAITNTSLLTCQSNRFRDASSNNFAITVNGNTSVTNFAPFNPSAAYDPAVNGGSGYFDGTGDYLAITDNGAFDFGTGDFTVEGWIYRTGSNLSPSIIAGIGPTNGDWMFAINSSTLRWGRNYVAWDAISTTTSNFSGGWFHVVACRASGTLRLFINGAQVYSGANTISYNIANSTLAIGARQLNTGSATPGEFFDGYIANLRVIKGTAVYTAAFTPPTAPLTAITNTSLLTNFTNAGIVDASAKNDLVTVGNAQISTAQSKFGGSSMAFDGTGDWLIAPHTVDQQFGTGNFTVECWLYLNATGAARGIVGKGTATTGWLLSVNASNNVVFTYGSSTITSTATLAGSTWYHLAVVREGTGSNQTKIYIGGTNDGTGTVSTDFNQTNVVYVGANRTGGDALNGYIDDLRVTKGVARYTANFTPPTAPFYLK